MKDIEQKKTSSAALWTNYQSGILACWRASGQIGEYWINLGNSHLYKYCVINIWDFVTIRLLLSGDLIHDTWYMIHVRNSFLREE